MAQPVGLSNTAVAFFARLAKGHHASSALYVSAAIAALVIAPQISAHQASAGQRTAFTMASPDGGAPKGYDHLLCYAASPINAFTSANVLLTDQFFPTGLTATVTRQYNACTPAKKVLLYRKPLKGFKPNGHFVCYAFTAPPSVNQTWGYQNQLEFNSIEWSYPYGLCVPTYKYTKAGSRERGEASEQAGKGPKGYDHLMAYDGGQGGATFANPLPQTTVTLYDEFYPQGFTVTLGNPVGLLTPTKKQLFGKPLKGFKPNGHWVDYYFQQSQTVQDTRDYVNQLERNTVTVYYPTTLLVPTYSTCPNCPRTSTRRWNAGHGSTPLLFRSGP